VTAKIIGRNLGIVKKVTAVILDNKWQPSSFLPDSGDFVPERILESLLNAADDIAVKGRYGKAVVSMSFSAPWDDIRVYPRAYQKIARKSLYFGACDSDLVLTISTFPLTVAILKELDSLDTALVTASGNDGRTDPTIREYPAKFLGDGDLPNLIVVGATDGNCRRAGWSQYADWMTTWAP
jgi:hypothetical protein